MEGKYTLFKTSEGIFTVPILADKNNFKMKLDGHELSFRASIERYFIYYLCVYDQRGMVTGWLREVGKYNWNPCKVDRFVDEFIKLHPKTPAPEYSLELVPMQADEKEGLELPIPYHCLVLTAQGERDLMSILMEAPREKIRSRMVAWFSVYCYNYGYSFHKKCKGAQYEWLYESFLEQHALGKLNPRPISHEEVESAKTERLAKKRSKICKRVAIATIYLGVLVLFGFLSMRWVDDDKYFDLNMWCSIVFFLLLGFPLYYISTINHK